jgi:hypothetical protein
MLTRLAGCSVGPGISCDARKLAQTPRVTKKKEKKKKRKKEIWADLNLGRSIS